MRAHLYPFAGLFGWVWSLALPLALLVILVALAGCTPGALYVSADEATYEAIAPEYRAYVDADESLDDEKKARRRGTLKAWKARIEAAK